MGDVKMGDINLMLTTDAEIWASEFMRIIVDAGQPIDGRLMVAWFASMWAATHDPLQNKLSQASAEIAGLREVERRLREVLALEQEINDGLVREIEALKATE